MPRENAVNQSKLLFGVRVNESVRLIITVTPSPPNPPPLTVFHQQGACYATPFLNGRWEVLLEKGDHLVQLAVDRGAWFDGPLQCEFSAPVKLVVPQDLEEGKLVGWTGSIGIANDPKNPWPPPSVNAVACEVASAAWLAQAFAAQAESVWLERTP